MPTPETPNLSLAALKALAHDVLDDDWPFSLTDPTVRALAARFLEADTLLREVAEMLGDLLDDCAPDRPAPPRRSLLKSARDLAAKIEGRV